MNPLRGKKGSILCKIWKSISSKITTGIELRSTLQFIPIREINQGTYARRYTAQYTALYLIHTQPYMREDWKQERRRDTRCNATDLLPDLYIRRQVGVEGAKNKRRSGNGREGNARRGSGMAGGGERSGDRKGISWNAKEVARWGKKDTSVSDASWHNCESSTDRLTRACPGISTVPTFRMKK